MLTGLKFDLFMGLFFLWRGVTCFREPGKIDVFIDKFIKPFKGERRTGLPSFIILHDNLSTLVAFFICILSINFDTLSSFTHEKLKILSSFVFPLI